MTCYDWGSDLTQTAFAIGTGNGSEIESAFDNDISTNDTWNAWWAADPLNWGYYVTYGWIGQDFGVGNSKTITKYRIYAALLGSPRDWTFEGSDNGYAWTILHTMSGQAWSTNAWKTFVFSNATAYRYYRLNISNCNGSTLIVWEVEMYQCLATSTSSSTSTTTTTTTTTSTTTSHTTTTTTTTTPVTDVVCTIRPYRQSISHIWQTGIQKTLMGSERRSALFTWPRVKVRNSFRRFTMQERNWMRRMMADHSNVPWWFPLWPDMTKLTSIANSGQAVLTVGETASRHFYEGRYVILINPSDYSTYELGVINTAGIAATTITLTANLAATWNIGTIVCPLYDFRIASTQQINKEKRLVDSMQIDGVEIYEETRSFTWEVPTEPNDVFYYTPLVRGLSYSFEKLYESIQALGIGYSQSIYDGGYEVTTVNFRKASKIVQWDMLQYFDYHKGRYGGFWLPSWNEDIKISATFLSTADTLTVEDITTHTGLPYAKLVDKYLFFLWKDGSWKFRKIASVSDDNTILLDDTIDKACSDVNDLFICFATYVRFGADEFTLDYLVGQENPPAEVSLSFVNTTDWMGAGSSEPEDDYVGPLLPPGDGGSEPTTPSPDALSCSVDDQFLTYDESTLVRAIGGTAPFTYTLTCDDENLSQWGYGAATEVVLSGMGRLIQIGPVGIECCGTLTVDIEDANGLSATCYVTAETGHWVLKSNLCELSGVYDSWAVSGGEGGYCDQFTPQCWWGIATKISGNKKQVTDVRSHSSQCNAPPPYETVPCEFAIAVGSCSTYGSCYDYCMEFQESDDVCSDCITGWDCWESQSCCDYVRTGYDDAICYTIPINYYLYYYEWECI